VSTAEPSNGSVSTEAEPLRHLSLPEVVRLTLRRRIINNELPAGSRLLETKLAEEFGVSRTTLRSALRELKNDGLVEIAPRRGAFVARMNPSDIRDICFARYVLEAGAAAEARIDAALLERLDRAIEPMVVAAERGDLEAMVEADTQLHGVLVRAGGSRRVAELWHELDGQMGSLMRSSLERQQIDLDETVERHRLLVAAIATKRRPTIVKAIREHYLDPREPERKTS
jgi:GntR family transcriptional regulator, rspAB operon transcriptional repressor